MSRRSKNQNKRKINIKILLPIICIIIVVITFVLLFDMKRKTNEVSNSSENSVKTENIIDTTNTNTNISLENMVDENTVTNEVDEINVENTVETNTVQDNITSNSEDRYSENRQQKAIEIAEKYWGEDESIYFTNESVKSDDEYIVAAREKSSTEVKEYFKVNIKTKSVEVYY